MGAHSTLEITESRARKELLRNIQTCSREQLQQYMNALLDKRLYNCTIVDDDCEKNDDGVLGYSREMDQNE